MIVIYATLSVMLIILGYMIFKTMVRYGQHPTTFILITWFFSLTILNLLVLAILYGFNYYKTHISPYGGIPGKSGYEGPPGHIGTSIVEYKCVNKDVINNV
jgi:hypothetical protein